MTIKFVTGNKGKFLELKQFIPSVEQLKLDLPEIQEIDPYKIIQNKLKEAFKKTSGKLIVEDTSLYLEPLKTLPGPLIKWFLKALGVEGLSTLAKRLESNSARAKAIFAYAENPEKIHFFEGEVSGQIVAPIGEKGFGWDSIFLPNGFTKTFGELSLEEKNQISHRSIASKKLADFLKNND